MKSQPSSRSGEEEWDQFFDSWSSKTSSSTTTTATTTTTTTSATTSTTTTTFTKATSALPLNRKEKYFKIANYKTRFRKRQVNLIVFVLHPALTI